MLGGRFHSWTFSRKRNSKSDTAKTRSEFFSKYWVNRPMLILDFGIWKRAVQPALGMHTKGWLFSLFDATWVYIPRWRWIAEILDHIPSTGHMCLVEGI